MNFNIIDELYNRNKDIYVLICTYLEDKDYLNLVKVDANTFRIRNTHKLTKRYNLCMLFNTNYYICSAFIDKKVLSRLSKFKYDAEIFNRLKRITNISIDYDVKYLRLFENINSVNINIEESNVVNIDLPKTTNTLTLKVDKQTNIILNTDENNTIKYLHTNILPSNVESLTQLETLVINNPIKSNIYDLSKLIKLKSVKIIGGYPNCNIKLPESIENINYEGYANHIPTCLNLDELENLKYACVKISTDTIDLTKLTKLTELHIYGEGTILLPDNLIVISINEECDILNMSYSLTKIIVNSSKSSFLSKYSTNATIIIKSNKKININKTLSKNNLVFEQFGSFLDSLLDIN